MDNREIKSSAFCWAQEIKALTEERDPEIITDPEASNRELDPMTYRSWYVDSILNISPSGKYYTPWTSNQTEKDVLKDQVFWETLNEELERLLPGYWLEHGEGDPLDIYLLGPGEEWEI